MRFKDYYFIERNESYPKARQYANAVVQALRDGRISYNANRGDSFIEVLLDGDYPATRLDLDYYNRNSHDANYNIAEKTIYLQNFGDGKKIYDLYKDRKWDRMYNRDIGKDIGKYIDGLSSEVINKLISDLTHEAIHHYDYEIYSEKDISYKINKAYSDSMRTQDKRIRDFVNSNAVLDSDKEINMLSPYYRTRIEQNAYFSGFLSRVEGMKYEDALDKMKQEQWYKALRPKDQKSMQKRLYQSL